MDTRPAAIAAAAEAEALRRNLLTRAAMGATADWLDQPAQLGQDVFRRGLPEVSITRRGGDFTDLLRACLVAPLCESALISRVSPVNGSYCSWRRCLSRITQPFES